MKLHSFLSARLTAPIVFHGLVAIGAALSLIAAAVVVYGANRATLAEFQERSVQIEAQKSAEGLAIYVDDRRRTLQALADNRIFASAVRGNEAALGRVESLLKSYGVFPDQRRIALVNILLDPVIDHTAPEFENILRSNTNLRSMAGAVMNLNVVEPQVDHHLAGRTDIISFAIPIFVRGEVEGMLYAEYSFDIAAKSSEGEYRVILQSDIAPDARAGDLMIDDEGSKLIQSTIAGTNLTHLYIRNVEGLMRAREMALLKLVGAVALVIFAVYAVFACLGNNLMLTPYLALVRSRKELSQANQQLEELAVRDPLTGLFNRRGLEASISAHEEKHDQVSYGLFHIDLDRFKQINDTLGHAAGDHVICAFGDSLRAQAREDELIARIGGDEFVLFIPDVTDPDVLGMRALAIIEAASAPIPFEDNECRIGASVGVAIRQGARGAFDRALVEADIALYSAKRDGRNTFRFFSEADAARLIETRRLTDEIARGVENGEFVPFFQPQIQASDRSVVGVEALVRWNHPRLGLLPPDQFLPAAEGLGIIDEIDATILRQAIDALPAIREAAGAPVRISVNVSGKRLRDPDLVASTAGLAFQPGDLVFELLETAFFDQSDTVIDENLAGLRERGVEIEIDDFGTGRASIVGLTNIRPRRLKIDRELVLPSVADEGARKIVKSIVDIASVLAIETVAEGVETEEHIAILTAVGCDYVQGYAISRPIALEDLLAWLRAQSVSDAA